MKNNFKSLKIKVLFLLVVSSFIACDKDFSVLESDVLGEGNINFNNDTISLPIVAYNKKLKSLQVNSLASNLLGFFDDPAYGQTTASIVTQMLPVSFNSDFGNNPKIDSVILNIPYYSKVRGVDGSGNPTYSLDSIYGNVDSEIKLSIYQNKYFLRAFNPYTGLRNQNYYSFSSETPDATHNYVKNDSTTIDFDNNKGDLIYQNNNFSPSENLITAKGAPALKVFLDTLFWKKTIIDKSGSSVLSNASNFNNYFRGLYIKAEAISGTGNMFLLNLASSNANISIYYSKDSNVAGERIEGLSYTLNFSGIKLNTFINNYNKVTFPTNPNKNLGDEKLYLKGAEGSMAIIDLFGKDNAGLENFIKEYRVSDNKGGYVKNTSTDEYLLKKLINEAQLIIYEDETLPASVDKNGEHFHKYDRVYAYDIKNNRPTIDYLVDPTEDRTVPINSKISHLGQRDPNKGKFKITLTEHLTNILKKDSTNTQIGVVLSSNVNYTSNAKILSNDENGVTNVPAATLITPRGTILHGSNKSVPKEKRMRLKVFSTSSED